MRLKAVRGYTLVEVIIVLGMIGILSSMAFSAFNGYKAEADRAQAQADLYEIAQIMERGFTQTRDYSAVTVSIDAMDDGRYDFSLSPAPTPTTYFISATVTNSRDNNDLGLDNTGAEWYREHGDTLWIAGWEIPN